MSRLQTNSVRSVALAAAFCALSIAAGCGRATFDLLTEDSLVSAGQPPSAGAGIGGGSGAGGNSGAAGKGFGGYAGRLETAGFGGRITSFPGSGAGNLNCGGEGGCADEGPFCPPYSPSPFCIPCLSKYDCGADAKVCDPDLKRCVQCRKDIDCGPGNACNPLTQRCAKACDNKDDCAVDSQHLLCNQELHVCVSCNRDQDCASYGLVDAHCFLYACVECFEDRQCALTQTCIAGHCTKH